MKIAVTSQGTDLESAVDPRFGRAAYIIIIDSDTYSFEVVDNRDNANALKGAGIQAAVTVSDKGAEILLTGHCGPNAFKALKAAKVGVVNSVSGSVRDALHAFLAGELQVAQGPDVDGQW